MISCQGSETGFIASEIPVPFTVEIMFLDF